MNREAFEKLPEAKKKIIEQAYYAAYNKEIGPNDFFTICQNTLTEGEYTSVFSTSGEPRYAGNNSSNLGGKNVANNLNVGSNGSVDPRYVVNTNIDARYANSAGVDPRYVANGSVDPRYMNNGNVDPRYVTNRVNPDPRYGINPNVNNSVNIHNSNTSVNPYVKNRHGREEIKTENIEDIMQYSGIDLKEEAENIVKDAEHSIGMISYENEDYNNQIESLFNPAGFREFIVGVCAVRRINITEEAVQLLFLILKRKLLDFCEKMAEAARIRTEAGLADFSFQITNEVSKQLWYLNELEKNKMDRLMIKKDEDLKRKKMIQEREDLVIKKRQSNNVAMAAMGLKQKSWMDPEASRYSEEQNKFSSIYSPFNEKTFDDTIKNRTITMKDYIYVLEKDKRYNKSIFLIQNYFK